MTEKLSRWICALFGFLLTLQVAVAAIDLPNMGAPSGNLITPAEEQRLGRAFMRSIRKSMKVMGDPLMEQYIRNLGARVVQGSGAIGTGFNFFIVEDPQINAFAGPAGHIGVYSGLIITTESESELASVLAHEIAHVTQQHLVRSFDDAKRMNLPATALAIAALVIGAAADNPSAGAAAATGIQAGFIQRQINFTRSHEEEADSIGIQTLANAGFDPRAMPSFFSRMGKANRLYDSGKLPEFLRTHPVTSNRVADAFARAESYPYKQQADSLEYHLTRARLKLAAFDSPEAGLNHFKKTLEEGRYRNQTAQRYGYLLSLIATRDYTTAQKELNSLLEKHPEQTEFIVSKANLEQASGQPRKALQTLEQGLKLYPENYPLTLYAAQALIELGNPEQAITMLSRYLRDRPDELELYKLLARASGDAGNESAGHKYLSEYYYLSGSLKRAQHHLETALKDRALDYYESAKLTARLKEVRAEIADLEGETR